MKREKKRQIIGELLGLLLGAGAAYMLWGFESPGGILILFGFSIGGLIGWSMDRDDEKGGEKND